MLIYTVNKSSQNPLVYKVNTGSQGLSAYEIAVKDGFTGTREAWLASLIGPKGDKGDQGIQGEKGDTGDKGDQGIQGEKGDTGDKGDQGIQGEKGDQGISAYQVAVLEGYTGTEAEWLASLVGPQGLKGDQGIQGLKGDKGDQGIQGLKGDQGIQGLKGDKGDQGIQGLKGDKGDKGSTGNSAYEEAVSLGYVGTEEEWIASLKGDKGDKGDSSVSVTVSPSNIVIPCQPDLSNPSLDNAHGAIEVRNGAVDITEACTFTPIFTSCEGSVTASGLFSISAMLAKVASITIAITHPTVTDIPSIKILAVLVPKGDKGDKGDTGDDAEFVFLFSTSQVIRKQLDNTLTPNPLDISFYKATGNTISAFNGYYVLTKIVSGTLTLLQEQAGSGVSVIPDATWDAFQCLLYQDNTKTILLDRLYVNVIRDGEKGDKGDKGDQGDQGIQGLKGDKGDQGDVGPAGESYEGYSCYLSEKDAYGIFTVLTFKDASGVSRKVSTLSGGTAPYYSTRTVQYYDASGALTATKVYTLSYINNELVSEVLQ